MTEIQETRVKILDEASRRMRYQDYSELPFADTDELVKLYKAKRDWEKKLKPKYIGRFDLSEYHKIENEQIEEENKRIKDTYIKPLEFKISLLEVEKTLFEGLFSIIEDIEDMHKRVYPKEEEQYMNFFCRCSLCPNEIEQEISLPTGWVISDIDNESLYNFCPEHNIIDNFRQAQCTGCVGGWGECQLWRSFAYGKNTLTKDDFNSIENGICPKRTNGTGMISSSGVERINLSDKASIESSKAFSEAIKNYIKLYIEKD